MPGAYVKGPATEALFCYPASLLSVGRVRKMSVCSRNPGVERVEQAELVLVSVGGEVAVGLVDHLQRRAHPSGECEQRQACGDRERRVRMPEVVGPAGLEPGRSKRRLPVPLAKVVQIEVATASAREEKRRVEARGHRVEGLENALAERHSPA